MTDEPQTDVVVHGHRLRRVHGRLDLPTAQAIIGLWLSQRVLSAAEAERRVHEVVYAAFNPAGELVGVNTVYLANRPDDGRRYWFYRTFLRPDARGAPALPRSMLALTIDYLRAEARRSAAAPAGLMIVTENPKLMQRAARAVLHGLGLQPLGKDPRGRDVWCLLFDGSTPSAPSSSGTTQ